MTGIDPRKYLLSEADSERIFQSQIVPDELGGTAAAETPCVVFVAGQPGAGKTKTTEAVTGSFAAAGGAVVVNSDFYKPHHPMYRALLKADDVTAAPYTSLDGRRWMAKAEAWLIEHRRNVIVETTMRDPGDFIDPARLFRGHGYQVETVVLAVPEPLSRLGILARYAEQVRDAGSGRLTETANHDASYQGVAHALEAAEAGKFVDVLSVWRRGNHLLYANQLDDQGNWAFPPAAARVLTGERARPLTYPEALSALSTLRGLRQALMPGLQWAASLTEVETLLMPQLPPGAAQAAQAAQSFPKVGDPLIRATNAADTDARLGRAPGVTRADTGPGTSPGR